MIGGANKVLPDRPNMNAIAVTLDDKVKYKNVKTLASIVSPNIQKKTFAKGMLIAEKKNNIVPML